MRLVKKLPTWFGHEANIPNSKAPNAQPPTGPQLMGLQTTPRGPRDAVSSLVDPIPKELLNVFFGDHQQGK